jgi:hypothetical protein
MESLVYISLQSYTPGDIRSSDDFASFFHDEANRYLKALRGGRAVDTHINISPESLFPITSTNFLQWASSGASTANGRRLAAMPVRRNLGIAVCKSADCLGRYQELCFCFPDV